MYHVFFIHSSVDGHLGCFHVLAVVNYATVNIGVHVSFQITVFSRCMPRRTWMNFEDIILCEINQSQKDKHCICDSTYIRYLN